MKNSLQLRAPALGALLTLTSCTALFGPRGNDALADVEISREVAYQVADEQRSFLVQLEAPVSQDGAVSVMGTVDGQDVLLPDVSYSIVRTRPSVWTGILVSDDDVVERETVRSTGVDRGASDPAVAEAEAMFRREKGHEPPQAETEKVTVTNLPAQPIRWTLTAPNGQREGETSLARVLGAESGRFSVDFSQDVVQWASRARVEELLLTVEYEGVTAERALMRGVFAKAVDSQ